MYKFMEKNIFEQSICLDNLGIKNVAWQYRNISSVIDCFSNNGIIILGGDIYYEHDGKLELSYDNWFYPLASSYSDSEESISKARKYLETIAKNRGENFWVSFQIN